MRAGVLYSQQKRRWQLSPRREILRLSSLREPVRRARRKGQPRAVQMERSGPIRQVESPGGSSVRVRVGGVGVNGQALARRRRNTVRDRLRAKVCRHRLSRVERKVQARLKSSHRNQEPWRGNSRHVQRESAELSRSVEPSRSVKRVVDGAPRVLEFRLRQRQSDCRHMLDERVGRIRRTRTKAGVELVPVWRLTPSPARCGMVERRDADGRSCARTRPRPGRRDRRPWGWRQRDAHRSHLGAGATSEERFRATVGTEQRRSQWRWFMLRRGVS